MPVDLAQRLFALADRMQSTASDIIRTAVLKEVRLLESQFEEEDRKRLIAEAENKRDKRSVLLNPPPGMPTVTEPEDELSKIYAKHAKAIFEVLSEPTLLRTKTQEAIAAIKRYAPLTHPKDDVICLRLEKSIRELQIEDIQRATQDLEQAVEPTRQALTAMPQEAGEKVGRILDSLLSRITTPSTSDPKGEPHE